jgi:hypothetical protein
MVSSDDDEQIVVVVWRRSEWGKSERRRVLWRVLVGWRRKEVLLQVS